MRKYLLLVFMSVLLASFILPVAAQGETDYLATLKSGYQSEYVVVKGDTLKKIAAESYGDHRLWPAIWWVNADSIQNPDRIEKDQVLAVPALPFAASLEAPYAPQDAALIKRAYIAAYGRYLELGNEWTEQRHWALLQASQFDPDLAASESGALDLADLGWLAARLGLSFEDKAAVELTFIETTDIHGAIFPYNFIKAAPMKNSLAQVATLVARERAAPGREVVLMDDGDSLQGQPTVYYYNFQKTDAPHIWGQALNALGYDAVGVGNHDIEAGHSVYDRLYSEIKAPVLCANAVKEDGTPYFTPYTIIERQGVKIAILGMITPKIPDWLPPQFWSGMTFVDMVQTAKKWVPIIQETEKPDLLIGLFHAGVDYTYGGTNKDTPNNENAAQLVAEQVPGFDMIFAGHDHQGWDGQGWDPAAKKKIDVVGPDGKRVYIFGAKNAAANAVVAKVDLAWDKYAKKWTKAIGGSLAATEGVEPDSAFLADFQGGYDEVKDWVDRPVGTLAGSITTRDSMFGDSAFVDLIHRIQLELSADPEMGLKAAQVSFAAPLTFDATIPSSADGTMYVRDMFNLYQYENFLYTMDMTGWQIKDFLEYSYKLWLATMPNEGDHLIALTKDKDGKTVTAAPSYNYDSAAGIVYTVDVTQPAGSRVTIESLADGSPFDFDSTYTVAINSYRGQGGGGHLTTGAGLEKAAVQKLQFVNGATTKDLRFYLLKWFEKQEGAVTVDALGTWQIVPEDLAAQGRETDFPILYPDKK